MIWASLNFVAFSPDGRVVLSGSTDSKVLFWHPAMLTEPSSVLENVAAPRFFGFSPDSRRILSGGPTGIGAIRDLKGTMVVPLVGHTAALHSAAFSPDANHAVTASDDGTARIWDTATGRELARCVGHSNFVSSAIFTLDGQRVITSGRDNMIRLWDASTGRGNPSRRPVQS
jgi:WD40 repeat protein